MLFKLSFRNMKKSIKDFAIYFLTLVLGVAIFYMFNSLDSQEAMMQVSNSTRDLIKLMIQMMGMVSVFVAVILGLLIVYANNFLINRRKKEFGIYMILGMRKKPNFKNNITRNSICWNYIISSWISNRSIWFAIYVNISRQII